MYNGNSGSSDRFNTYVPRRQHILNQFRSPTQWTSQISTIILARIGTPNQMRLAQDQVLFLIFVLAKYFEYFGVQKNQNIQSIQNIMKAPKKEVQRDSWEKFIIFVVF